MSSKTKITATKEEAKPALVPKLRFPEFRGAEEWAIEEVGDLLAESRTPSSLNDPSKRITVRLHLQGVEHREHRGTESTESTNNFCRKAGQFIYGKQNIHKGAFGIIPDQLDGFETSQDLPCFDFKRRCCPQWFYSNFASEAVYGPLELKMTGTGSKRLNEKTFLSLPIAVPSYPEQQKIAECLSSVDALMAAQARKVDALKTHKKGLMQQLFPREGETQPRLRFPEFKNAGEWETKRLDDLVDIQSGTTPAKANSVFWNGFVPWVSAKDMKRLFLEDSEDHISAEAVDAGARLVPPGTLLMLTRGMTLLKDVPICVLRREMSFNQDVKGLRPKDGVDGLFLAWMLTGNKQRLLAMVNVAGHGTGKLDTDELKALELAVPPPAEQQRIAACLSSLDALITAATQKLETLKTHKQGLMQQLFPSPEAVEA